MYNEAKLSSFNASIIKQYMIALNKFIIPIVIAFNALLGGVAYAGEIPNSRLLYQVNYVGNNVGMLEVFIEKKQDQYCTTAITHLSTLAKLFLSEQKTVSCFDITDQGLRLAEGRDFHLGEDDSYRNFRLDYSSEKIYFSRGEVLPFPSAEVQFESTSFPLFLISHDPFYFTGRALFDINAKRLRLYKYDAPANDTVMVNGTEVPVLSVKRYGDNDPSRHTTYFLDPRNHRFPVKIIDHKKGKNTVMTLLEYSSL